MHDCLITECMFDYFKLFLYQLTSFEFQEMESERFQNLTQVWFVLMFPLMTSDFSAQSCFFLKNF